MAFKCLPCEKHNRYANLNGYMKKSRKDLILLITFIVLAVAINAYIIYHACLNGMQSSNASEGVVEVSEEVVNTVRPNTITEANHDQFATFIRKAFGHFGLFTLSGIFSSFATYFVIKDTRWYTKGLGIGISFLFGFLLAVLTEIIQLNVPGRSGEFVDVLIDTGGYVIGLGITVLILALALKHQAKKKENH